MRPSRVTYSSTAAPLPFQEKRASIDCQIDKRLVPYLDVLHLVLTLRGGLYDEILVTEETMRCYNRGARTTGERNLNAVVVTAHACGVRGTWRAGLLEVRPNRARLGQEGRIVSGDLPSRICVTMP